MLILHTLIVSWRDIDSIEIKQDKEEEDPEAKKTQLKIEEGLKKIQELDEQLKEKTQVASS
jgi:hypothetical protein